MMQHRAILFQNGYQQRFSECLVRSFPPSVSHRLTLSLSQVVVAFLPDVWVHSFLRLFVRC